MMCQSILSALACALERADIGQFNPAGVSRSSARWPAR